MNDRGKMYRPRTTPANPNTMYDGDLDPMDEVVQILEGETHVNDDFKPVPTTPQDEVPHQDGLFGRNYDERFDPAQIGRPHDGTQNQVLNDPENAPDQPDGDHFDVIERDPQTDTLYHNRVHDPALDTGPEPGP